MVNSDIYASTHWAANGPLELVSMLLMRHPTGTRGHAHALGRELVMRANNMTRRALLPSLWRLSFRCKYFWAHLYPLGWGMADSAGSCDLAWQIEPECSLGIPDKACTEVPWARPTWHAAGV